MSPSGVGTQTKMFIEALLKTDRYKFVCLGGAIKHQSYEPQAIDPWGEDFIVYPVDGYGNQDAIRSILRTERPDVLWFMTDPRFYEWLWTIENEVRPLIPMVYYHVWDNYYAPKYNDKFYKSNDKIVCISKVTHDIVKEVSPSVDSEYLPHTTNPDVFCRLNSKAVKEDILKEDKDKFVLFFNSRNARRKMSGNLIVWFKDFLDMVGHDKAMLLMHTNPKDPNGPDLEQIVVDFDLMDGQVKFSTAAVVPETLCQMYNAVDLTVAISDAEGFGLSCLESLNCATPVLVTMTGGLQEQVTDGKKWFGRGIRPCSQMVVGSQQVPYIYEDRINKETFLKKLKELYDMWKNKPEKYEKMGLNGMKHMHKNYNFNKFEEKWVKIMDDVVEKHGSWENRKGYESWEVKEL